MASLHRVQPQRGRGAQGYAKAEVTGGGLPLDEVDCATLESRLRPGLFVCGELLDVFGRIGGFNFYWARPCSSVERILAMLRPCGTDPADMCRCAVSVCCVLTTTSRCVAMVQISSTNTRCAHAGVADRPAGWNVISQDKCTRCALKICAERATDKHVLGCMKRRLLMLEVLCALILHHACRA